MGFVDNPLIPTISRITIWICLAHIWIVLCAIVYVKLEGFDKSSQTIHQVDLYLAKVFSGNTKPLQKINSKEFINFKKDYDAALEKQDYWQMRNEFNDISKAYIFVLSAHTTIGNQGTYLNHWKSRLFYIFTVPIGVLMYYLMIHYVAVQLFEIIAYAVVTTFPKKTKDWTEDQHELYEKVKVAAFTLLMLAAVLFLFGLIAIPNHDSYLTGLYYAMDLVLTISATMEYTCSKLLKPDAVAIVLTFLYFCSLLFLYMVMYSVFILFRYNDLDDVYSLFSEDRRKFYDVSSDDEEQNLKNEQLRRESVIYFEAKVVSQNIGSKPPELYNQDTEPVAYAISDEAMALTDDNESIDIPMKKKKKKRRSLSKLVASEGANGTQLIPDIPNHVPAIEVTVATPSPPKTLSDEDNISATSSFDSDFSNSGNYKNKFQFLK